ncbi:MAG: zinc-binding dehydrogenase [Thermoplasmata archaeon]
MGITGKATYFGITEVGRPRRGVAFVASGATGGVGSTAGQIAKILGLRMIGIAGGKEKCDWLVHEDGFDGVIDYRSGDVGAQLSTLCPERNDHFFDSVGRPVLDEALSRLRSKGRIVLCGATSWCSQYGRPPGPSRYTALLLQNGRMEGFMAGDFADRFPEAREPRPDGSVRGSSFRGGMSWSVSRTRRRPSPDCSRAPVSESSC